MQTVQIKMIRSDKEYEAMLEIASELMNGDQDDPVRRDVLEALALVIEKYEDERWPMEVTNPVEAIRDLMDRQDLRPKDLAPFMGGPTRVSEILNWRRKLTLDQIWALHVEFDLPLEVLAKPYHLEDNHAA